MKLEEITKGVAMSGLSLRGLATVVAADWLGEDQVHVFFRTDSGPDERISDSIR